MNTEEIRSQVMALWVTGLDVFDIAEQLHIPVLVVADIIGSR